MAFNVQNVLCLYLILSSIGPARAARVEMELGKNMMDEDADQTQNQTEEYEYTMQQNTTSAAAGHSCPAFLRSNETAHLCYYEGGFEHPDSPEEFSHLAVFDDAASDRPLIFDNHNHGGAFKVQSQFISEMAAAMASKEAMEVVFKDVVELELGRNITFKEKMDHMIHEAHRIGEDIKPIEFLVVHAGLHIVLEAVVLTMHGLEALAEIGLHGGLAITEGLIETAAFGAIAVGAHEVAAFVPIIGWALLVPMGIFDIWMARKHYKDKHKNAEDFAKRLVLKSRCMENQVGVRQKMVLNAGFPASPAKFVKPVVSEVCGVETARLISVQMQRANFEMMRLFRKIEQVGRCIFPHGQRETAKRNCAAAVYLPLREAHGSPGLIFEALMLAATYADQADEISDVEHYGPWFRVEFGIDIQQKQTFHKMFNELREKDLTHRAVGCMSILATHRAFEQVFKRLSKAVPIWMKTFARDIRHTDITLWSTNHPCNQVFYNPMHPEYAGENLDLLCKDEEFKTGKGDDEIEINEERPCMAEVTLWPMVAPSHH